MATQNPIEQEGTYPLPEAQLDRFLMHVKVDYPNAEAERKILALSRNEARGQNAAQSSPLSQESIFEARQQALSLHMSDAVENYIVQLIVASRAPQHYDAELAQWIEFGASPRATIALDRCSRVHAWLAGRDFVTPEDVLNVAPDVLRHRLLQSFEAEAKGISTDTIIDRLLECVPVG
jgi:MoxR-like ATPase